MTDLPTIKNIKGSRITVRPGGKNRSYATAPPYASASKYYLFLNRDRSYFLFLGKTKNTDAEQNRCAVSLSSSCS